MDIFVACIGTGGTISGTGSYLKSKDPNVKVVGVEPYSSPLLTKGVSGAHKIQGIGANFVPKNFLSNYVDQIECASDEDSYVYAKLLAKTQGVLVGISAGAALTAAINYAKENDNKNIVVILPDGGDKYLSTDLFK